MPRVLLMLFLGIVCSNLTSALASTQTSTINTYYPSPQGYYANLNVASNFTVANETAGPCAATGDGSAIFVNSGGTLTLCDKSGVYPLSNNTLWQYTGSSIEPMNTANGLTIGGSTVLGGLLTVTGGSGGQVNSIGGATNFGSGVSPATVTINGVTQLNGTTQFNGAVTYGTASSPGAVTVQGTVGSTPGQLTVNGNISVNGQTYVTDNSGAQGALQVSCISNKCYPVYE